MHIITIGQSTNKPASTKTNGWCSLIFLAKIEFNKSKKIQWNYNLKTRFSDVSCFANRYYLQSYNSVFRANKDLENIRYQSSRIYYSRFSLHRGVMLHAIVN